MWIVCSCPGTRRCCWIYDKVQFVYTLVSLDALGAWSLANLLDRKGLLSLVFVHVWKPLHLNHLCDPKIKINVLKWGETRHSDALFTTDSTDVLIFIRSFFKWHRYFCTGNENRASAYFVVGHAGRCNFVHFQIIPHIVDFVSECFGSSLPVYDCCFWEAPGDGQCTITKSVFHSLSGRVHVVLVADPLPYFAPTIILSLVWNVGRNYNNSLIWHHVVVFGSPVEWTLSVLVNFWVFRGLHHKKWDRIEAFSSLVSF